MAESLKEMELWVGKQWHRGFGSRTARYINIHVYSGNMYRIRPIP